MKNFLVVLVVLFTSIHFSDLKAQFKESFYFESYNLQHFVGCEEMDTDGIKELVYYNYYGSVIYIIDGQKGIVKYESNDYQILTDFDRPQLVDTNNDGRFELIFYGIKNNNHGLYSIKYDGSSSIPQEPIQKQGFVEQNFPNPFADVTTIKYSVKSYGQVTLKIYDLQGKELYSLINENKEIGDYQIKLDSLNLKSGNYLYQFIIGNEVGTKQMIKM